MQTILFLPDRNNYDVVTGFTHELKEAFLRLGHNATILSTKAPSIQALAREIEDIEPDFTLCFNGLLPHKDLGFLADYLKIPHLAYLIDPPFIFLPLIQSPYTHISCIDEDHLPVFHALDYKRCLFLPHAYDPKTSVVKEKSYPYTFLGSSVDYMAIRRSWDVHYGEKVARLLEYLSLLVLKSETDSTLNIMQEATSSSLTNLLQEGFLGFSCMEIWRQIELYARGRDRQDLLEQLEGKEVHLFGNAFLPGSAGWRAPKGCTLHPAVSYSEGKTIIGKTDVLLNSSPFYKGGSHERILAGLASGCRVLTSQSRFVKKNFNKALLTYNPLKKQETIEHLSTFQPLVDQKVLSLHSWDARAQHIIDYFKPVCSLLRTGVRS